VAVVTIERTSMRLPISLLWFSCSYRVWPGRISDPFEKPQTADKI